MTNQEIINLAKSVIEIEQNGITLLKNSINDNLVKAIEIIMQTKNKVIVSGLGKSGHIANKIAATLASTGTPSFFVHPTEALHGDLGMISKNDSLIIISNSGLSKELAGILNYAVRFKIPIIAFTSNLESDLAKAATVILELPKANEACILGKAPTTSTTLSLVLGDALAITLLKLRGFDYENYKIFHPGGSLGASLMKVNEVMHKDKDLPMVITKTKMSEALITITSKKFGCTAIVDKDNTMLGIITDGDIRRHMAANFLTLTVDEVMTNNFSFIGENDFVSKALANMQNKSITNLFVLNDKKQPIGIVHIHDLLNLGII
ncbi:SIS domain-containing protein [Rickettsiales bacterium LUAb2]